MATYQLDEKRISVARVAKDAWDLKTYEKLNVVELVFLQISDVGGERFSLMFKCPQGKLHLVVPEKEADQYELGAKYVIDLQRDMGAIDRVNDAPPDPNVML